MLKRRFLASLIAATALTAVVGLPHGAQAADKTIIIGINLPITGW